MRSVKSIVLDGLKYFRQALLSDTPTSGDTVHALSLDGAYKMKPLHVNMGTISSLPVTKNVTGVTADMVVLDYILGTPSAQTSNWTITTSAGQVTVSGGIAFGKTTTLKIILGTPVSITAEDLP